MSSPRPRRSLSGLNRLRQAWTSRRESRLDQIDLLERRTLLAQVSWIQAGNGSMGACGQIEFLTKKFGLTSRQESSGKGDSWKLETFQMEPCG